nr:ABC transporter substrate-binding protein [Halorientalis brevis]
MYAAREAGAYSERNLSVTFAPRTGSGAALRDVVAGDSLLGIVGSTTLLRAVADEQPVVPLALLYQRALAVLYTTRAAFGEPFERVAQLRGRRLGMPVDSEIGLLGRFYLRQAGVADDVTVIDLQGEERTALLADTVDAVTGSLSDPARVRTGDATVDTIRLGDRFPIYGPAVVAREEALAAARSVLADFLAGTMVGVARARADPAVAASAVDGDESAARARQTFEDAIETGWTSDAVAAHGWGWHQAEDWERLRGVLAQVDLLTE